MKANEPDAQEDTAEHFERVTLRMTDDIDPFQGADGRTYDLRDGDVVRLPRKNADVLITNDVAERIDDHIPLNGPPEPVERDDGTVEFLHPTNAGDVVSTELGRWVCQRCGSETVTGTADGDIVEPHECSGCERQGPFDHAGDVSSKDIQAALRGTDIWFPPAGISDERFSELWDDVERFIYDHWDAGSGDDADAVYAGLTAYALSTWVRDGLTFVPHLMLMGSTTGGKTRLLNTLARVSYRAVVTASTSSSVMFRFIDDYDVTYFVSEYHGLPRDTQGNLDAVVRAGQKRGELVTRSEQTATGYEPRSFDPFTHVAIATQYEPDDDIVNRCIQVQSSTANRDMPATLAEERARNIRDRLLYFRYRLLDSERWAAAEERAYQYLAERDITGRTREKLLGLLTVAEVFGRVDDLTRFVEIVVEQDLEATADSEDALVVKAIRDAAHHAVSEVTTLGSDPYSAVTIPYSQDDEHEPPGIVERYEDMTDEEKHPSWLGHVVKRLGLEKERTNDGTVISDPDLGEKLRDLCEEFNLAWNPDTEENNDADDGDVSQASAVETVRSTVRELAKDADNGHVPRDDVIDELADDVGDRDPEHLVEQALRAGEFYEPERGYIAPT